ncbi:MAG: GNAT family N-acetyltransferase [Spirochaetes bacterium]|nr:GNAT family N-acetyltransferase [Spirochaetota bacterium]
MNSSFLFCIYDNNIIGCIDYHGGTQKRLEHTGMFAISVLKEYWNIGIGRILLESLIEWAKLTNIIKKINLKVKEDNGKAIKMYKKYGFIEEGKISRDYFIDGKFYSSIEMGLEV